MVELPKDGPLAGLAFHFAMGLPPEIKAGLRGSVDAVDQDKIKKLIEDHQKNKTAVLTLDALKTVSVLKDNAKSGRQAINRKRMSDNGLKPIGVNYANSRPVAYPSPQAHMRWPRRGILFLGVLMLAVTAWSYEQYPCVRNVNGKTVCPPPGGKCLVDAFGKIACSPPYGGIVMTIKGEMLCGPGKCMINVSGQAFCSAVSEGSMTFDSYGEPICTGGCIPASESACTWP